MLKRLCKAFRANRGQTKNEPVKPRRLVDVLDRHLNKHFKVWSINQITRTSLILFAILAAVLSSWANNYSDMLKADHVAVIQVIGDISTADGGTGYTAAKAFQAAIKDEKAAAILFSVDSGGGSPTEGEALYRAVERYVSSAPLHQRKPVVVTIRGMCASACYYAIAGADTIYSHHSSLVGSIGVRMDAYDVRELANELGIRRNTLSSGDNKTLLDPFRGLSEGDHQLLMDTVITPLFSKFVSDIETARDGKLQSGHPEIYSGMVFPGQKAIMLGFIDDIQTSLEVEQHLIDTTSATYIQVVNKPSFSFSRMLQSAVTDGVKGALNNNVSASN